MRFKKGNIPAYFIFAMDLLLSVCSVVLAFWLRFNFKIPEGELNYFIYIIPIVFLIRAVTFLIFKTYAGIIRYTSTEDAQRIFITISIGTLLISFTNFIHFHYFETYLIPFSVIIIDYIFTIFMLTAIRLFIKIMYLELKNSKKERTKVIIFGVGEGGIITKRTLDRDAGTNYKVIGFFDDNPTLANKKIEGVNIYHGNRSLIKLLRGKKIDQLIITIFNISPARKKEIIDICLRYNVKVLHIPPMNKWINGELSFNQIKGINIEDLLERDTIHLDNDKIKAYVLNKTILITGAAGSIGSEIVRQLIKFKPDKLILLDIAESPLYELELELQDQLNNIHYEIIIADIRNKENMKRIFYNHLPEVVYHAAAYKHVPMMENNPGEAVLTNINGTKIVADLAVKHQVEKFVFVSTDKAVNPTNVMGASKRIAEIYVQSLNSYLQEKGKRTQFITTRFGNVLGSNGSVIPLFRKQIEKGGPITVTHPEVTRYFMTIPEACQLVLEAGAIGNGGEIFIFDMGECVKIADLAKKMIKLSGLELGKDIQLTFTGLRPGEKLYEELLNSKENTLPTHHSKIMIAKVQEYEYSQVTKDIKELINDYTGNDPYLTVGRMKNIIPEFISKNSIFERLDKKIKAS